MMELIFGEFSERNYFDAERSEPEGIYRPARTVRTGPFKLMSLSFMLGEAESDTFWMTGTSDGVEKICYPYGDYVRVPLWQFVSEVTLFILWVVALLFSIVSLLAKLVRKICNIHRKKQIDIPLDRWSTLVAIVQIAMVILFVVMASQALSYALASSYAWTTVVLGIIALALAGLAVYGIVMIPKAEFARKRKIYNWTTVILSVTTVGNIVYWNLFMGWKI